MVINFLNQCGGYTLILKFVKWISYLVVLNKGFKFVVLLFRFVSYLLSGSFIAAFMVLYDFTS